MTKKQQQKRVNDGKTHYEGCYRHHPECAEEAIREAETRGVQIGMEKASVILHNQQIQTSCPDGKDGCCVAHFTSDPTARKYAALILAEASKLRGSTEKGKGD